MRITAIAGGVLILALGVSAPARADETNDLAICMNVTVLTHRDSPPAERLVGCNSMIKAHSAKPQAADFYYRAAVYSLMNRPQDALSDLDTALNLNDPNEGMRAAYHLDRAGDMLLAGLRTADDALADATSALEILSARGPDAYSNFANDMSRAYFWRGCAYAEKEDKAHASADFKKALSYDVNPKWRDVMVKLLGALGYPSS